MSLYIGNSSNTAQLVTGLKIGVRGIAKEVKRVYVGDNEGKARLVYNVDSDLGNFSLLSSVGLLEPNNLGEAGLLSSVGLLKPNNLGNAILLTQISVEEGS